jgi:hypothetical protein
VVDVTASSCRSARDTVTLRRVGGEGASVAVCMSLLVPPASLSPAPNTAVVTFEGPRAPAVPGRYRLEYNMHGVSTPACVSEEFVVNGPTMEVSAAVDGWGHH